MDIGEKRIGIALTDSDKELSIPHSIIKNDRYFQKKFNQILDDEAIEKIIIGMPYTLKKEIGEQGKKVIDFVKDKILGIGMEVVYQDERFTSKFPVDGYLKKNKLRKYIDKYSAALILQSYLDRKKRVNDE